MQTGVRPQPPGAPSQVLQKYLCQNTPKHEFSFTNIYLKTNISVLVGVASVKLNGFMSDLNNFVAKRRRASSTAIPN